MRPASRLHSGDSSAGPMHHRSQIVLQHCDLGMARTKEPDLDVERPPRVGFSPTWVTVSVQPTTWLSTTATS